MIKKLLNYKNSSSFRKQNSLEKRKQEAERVKQKHPSRVPIICERGGLTEIPLIDKKKYLVPGDLTAGQFIYVIRKRLELDAAKAIFIFINNSIIPPSSAYFDSLYDTYKNEDGFLYITYSGENTFGKKIR